MTKGQNFLGGEPVHSYDFATARAPSGDPILGAPHPAQVVSHPPSAAEIEMKLWASRISELCE